MDILDRLLGHDAAMTRELLMLAAPLSDEELDRQHDIDHGSLRSLLHHMIRNVEVWTDLMEGHGPRARGDTSIADLVKRHERSMEEFTRFSRRIVLESQLDTLWTDHLDDPPTQKTYGGAIGHVVTHNMHHRAHVLTVMRWLGVPDLPEGDLLGWERATRTL